MPDLTNDNEPATQDVDPGSKPTRRVFLKDAAGVAGAVVGTGSVSGLVSACGGSTGGPSSGKGGRMIAARGNTLDFACILPVAGAFTIVTKPWYAAMQIAASERNAAGGVRVGGRALKVNVPLLDEGYAAAPSLIAARQFFSNNGHYTGGFVSVEGPQAVLGINDRADAMLVSTITGVTALSYDKLRIYNNELAQATGPYKADFAYNELGARRVATIELKNAWGNDYQQSFATAFEQLGGKIVDRAYMLVTQTDFTATISSWKPLAPDLIYIIIGDGPGVTIGNQLGQLGFNSQPLLLEGAWDPNSFAKAGAGFIHRGHYSGMAPYVFPWNSAGTRVATEIHSRSGLYPTNWVWQAYDSMRIVLDAIELADSTDPRAAIQAVPEAVKNGVASGKWVTHTSSAFLSARKGCYLNIPFTFGQFKAPGSVNYAAEPPMAPVKNPKYHNLPGVLAPSWAGYQQPYGSTPFPSLRQAQQLRPA